MDVLFSNKMVSFKYYKLIIISLIFCVNINASQQKTSNENGVIIYSEENQQGYSTFLKEGFYIVSELPHNIKSFKIISDKIDDLKTKLSKLSNESLNTSISSTNSSDNGTSNPASSGQNTNLLNNELQNVNTQDSNSSDNETPNSTATNPSTSNINAPDNGTSNIASSDQNVNPSNNNSSSNELSNKERYEVIFSNSEDIGSRDDKTKYPLLDDGVIKYVISNNITESKNDKFSESTDNKDIYNINEINTSLYKYMYIRKIDLNNKDGVSISCDECNYNTGKYYGRQIKSMQEVKDKDKITDITIYNSPDFQELPDLTQYKNLKNIRLIFNVFKGKDKTSINKEYNKLINYINKVHPLTIIEIPQDLPNYHNIITENNITKLFAFNLKTLPSLSNDIQEIYLINCNVPISAFTNYIKNCKKLQKIYMYGNTFELASNEQWNELIKQIFNLSIDVTTTTEKRNVGKTILSVFVPFVSTHDKITETAKGALTHVQLPRTFTGEIPKVNDDSNKSQIQYLSALGATSVAQDAFKENQNIKELYLQNVREVKSNAFYHCYNLTTVYLDKCEVLQTGVFRADRGLKSVHLPIVKKLEELSLAYTRSNELKIGDLNNTEFKNSKGAGVYLPFCLELGKGALRGDVTDQSQFTTINLPICQKIGVEAFRHLKSLKEINIPEAKTIDKCAFENDGELTKVGDVKSMTSNGIYLPKVVSIAEYAFKNADKGTNTKQGQVADVKGQNNTIKYISLPECISIGRESFMRYRTFEKLYIPKCVSIDELAFYDAYKLQLIHAPLLEKIGDRVFLYASSKLNSYQIVDGKEVSDDECLEFPKLKSMGQYALGGNNYNHINTTKLRVPECTQMADNALQGSRIHSLEASKLSNTSKILSLTNTNV